MATVQIWAASEIISFLRRPNIVPLSWVTSSDLLSLSDVFLNDFSVYGGPMVVICSTIIKDLYFRDAQEKMQILASKPVPGLNLVFRGGFPCGK